MRSLCPSSLGNLSTELPDEEDEAESVEMTFPLFAEYILTEVPTIEKK